MATLNLTQQQFIDENSRFFQKVYGWMFLGLIISGITAYWIASDPLLYTAILFNKTIFYSLLIGELALILGLSWLIKIISSPVAILMFLLYCVTTGLTLSVIFLVYTIESIGQIFLISAGMFGAMSVYGYFTKLDLNKFGQVLMMGVFGLVIAGFTNLFLKSGQLDFNLSIIGVVVFTGLTAYHTQNIKTNNILNNEGTAEDTKESILGALTLYLAFINILLHLLKIFGKRRR